MKKEELKQGKYSSLDVDALKLSMDNYYYRGKGKDSIGFKIDVSNDVSRFFINTFKLPNEESFINSFYQSTGGDGGELTKNNALHSSSLCALLMFYNINKDNKVKIEIDGQIHEYDAVYFEIKNKVIKNPSNMDVVLVNTKKEEILFIECKFSEYLSKSKHELGVGYLENKEYKQIFDEIGYDNMTVFQYGIKQLVAHFIGINNFLKGYTAKAVKAFYRNKDYGRSSIYKKYNHVAFMEVIFKLDYPEYQTYLSETEKTFDVLKTKTNEISILGTKTYQELFVDDNSKILPELVKKFYKI